jgi:nucleoside-diphosphate-sugar epimerase
MQKWKESPIDVFLHDFNKIEHAIKECSHILISVPPNFDGTEALFNGVKDRLLKEINHIEWVGYLSSTSVYGNHDGLWVNEDSASKMPGPKGQRRLISENRWMSLFTEYGLPVHIFRLGGIYGPNRNGLIRLLNGKKQTVVKAGQFFSRIHVTDIARALLVSMNKTTPGMIYNLVDDGPSAPENVDCYAANLLHMPAPALIPFEKATLPAGMAAFYHDSKKVSNRKFKRAFGFCFLYPTYKEGLSSLFNAPK